MSEYPAPARPPTVETHARAGPRRVGASRIVRGASQSLIVRAQRRRGAAPRPPAGRQAPHGDAGGCARAHHVRRMPTNHVDPEPVFALSWAAIRAPAAVRAQISGFGSCAPPRKARSDRPQEPDVRHLRQHAPPADCLDPCGQRGVHHPYRYLTAVVAAQGHVFGLEEHAASGEPKTSGWPSRWPPPSRCCRSRAAARYTI